MLRRLAVYAFAGLLLGVAVRASAQNAGGGTPQSSLNGVFTVATLPSAAQNQGNTAFVTDLGGGADRVISDGTYWKHIRNGLLGVIAAATTVTVTPLRSPPIIQLSGSGLLTNMTLNVLQTNLYPGYTIHLIVPSGVLAAAATLGLSVNGGAATPLTNILGSWEDLQWNGTMFVELAKGAL